MSQQFNLTHRSSITTQQTIEPIIISSDSEAAECYTDEDDFAGGSQMKRAAQAEISEKAAIRKFAKLSDGNQTLISDVAKLNATINNLRLDIGTLKYKNENLTAVCVAHESNAAQHTKRMELLTLHVEELNEAARHVGREYANAIKTKDSSIMNLKSEICDLRTDLKCTLHNLYVKTSAETKYKTDLKFAETQLSEANDTLRMKDEHIAANKVVSTSILFSEHLG